MTKYRKPKYLIQPLGTLMIEGIGEGSNWHLPKTQPFSVSYYNKKGKKRKSRKVILAFNDPDELGAGFAKMIERMSKR
jgi:hypothetical protein